MATRNIAPRANEEGGIGTAAKNWLYGFIKTLVVTTINALTLTAQTIGFTLTGGTTPKTLTVDETVAMSDKAPKASPTFTGPITSGVAQLLPGTLVTNITTAKTIYAPGRSLDQALVIVMGDNGNDGYFLDLVAYASDSTATAVTSTTLYGSPPARTYTVAESNNLQLAMASGTYKTRVLVFASQP